MASKGINKRLKIIAIVLLLPLGILVPAFSLRSYHLPFISAQSNDNTAELQERKQRYKRAIGDDISTSEQERIKTRCLAVQTNIKAFSERLTTVQKRRGAVYDSVIEKLNKLDKNLQNQAYNTEALQSDIKTLTSKVDTYKATMKSFKQAVDDMTVIDCTQDPVSFKGALEEARTKHAELITQVRDIREYILNTVKPQLEQIRQELAEGRTAGGS